MANRSGVLTPITANVSKSHINTMIRVAHMKKLHGGGGRAGDTIKWSPGFCRRKSGGFISQGCTSPPTLQQRSL